MSIVGTRPPTLDEWNKYELHHRARLAIKPGITGMWQVSGRSEITDFEEVVKLDPEYISDYIIGSCKYRNEKIGVDELDLIRDYASVFGKGNNYYYYIFSKGGFTDGLLQAQERGEVRLITLEDLYK